MTVLNILALSLSLILSWHYLKGGTMIGCGGGSPCEQVLSSRWSAIAGILPISGLAVGMYLALLVAVLFIGPATEPPLRRMVWKVMLIMAGAIAGSAIWFTIIQKWFIGSFCPYCMTAHITGLILSILIIWRATRVKNVSPDASEDIISPLPAFGLITLGLAMAGILAVFQFAYTPPAVYEEGESQEKMITIDYKDAPINGSPDAPHILTLLFDYQCSHCQKIHFMLGEVIRQYEGKLAFVLCPAPLNSECNPYVTQSTDAFKNSCELARISLAVWFARSEAFPDFENWMFTYESGDKWQPRSPVTAREKAVELVGREAFDSALTDSRVDNYIQTCVRIFGQTLQGGRGGLPKLIYGSDWVTPEPNNSDDLVMILQKSLGVPVP